jgi:hypothetical protein
MGHYHRRNLTRYSVRIDEQLAGYVSARVVTWLISSVIATPGRFLHLMVEMSLDLRSSELIIYDEADR